MKNEFSKRKILSMYFRYQFSSKKLYIVLSSFIIVFWIIVLIYHLTNVNKLNYIFLNSIAIASIVCFVLSWLAFGLKIGLLSKTIDKIRNGSPEFQERKEKSILEKMTENEKRIYHETKIREFEYKNSFAYKTSFPYFFNCLIFTIIFTIITILSYI
ncbi:hypothetical protein [Mycoplasmopsis cynos]|uniref:DUF3899 domain-containing protein n=2 Tax=Mycoplasmopsis cynos TaxID=171284 RepID=L0RXA7_MYCC1|nr:hypothetical protein [Mycoplasmopsis cynos]UWV80319.1 hypothetical protein NW069_03075 [Mycoplasmopsis cynos]UWV82776.1 hypothetical protein NW067_00350 [Mycoplasmopsis cynos]UWV94070.1 hypothetical protein NW062_02090 [Mycoplasmopsis cynos]WAM03636.1 hypothetical protein ONA22_01035 [Mycoplasmopsis cynos]WAM06546.1 hypothetical protein ONA23_06405 [Mycoplasmopsis cynos]